MSARSRATRPVLLSLAVLGLACADAPTGIRDGDAEERLVVSVVGVAPSDAGILLQLTGAVHSVDPARPSLDLAWSTSAGVTTVAIIGALAESGDLLLVRRLAAPEPLRVEVVEAADGAGELSNLALPRAIVRAVATN